MGAFSSTPSSAGELEENSEENTTATNQLTLQSIDNRKISISSTSSSPSSSTALAQSAHTPSFSSASSSSASTQQSSRMKRGRRKEEESVSKKRKKKEGKDETVKEEKEVEHQQQEATSSICSSPSPCPNCIVLESENTQLRKELASLKQSLVAPYTCSICAFHFISPYTLGCGHTFCGWCLLQALRQNRKCALCRCIVKTPPVIASVHFRSQLSDSLLHLTAEERAEYRKEEGLRTDNASQTSLRWDKEWRKLFPPSRPPNYDEGIPMCPWCGYELERGKQCQNENNCGPIEWEQEEEQPQINDELVALYDEDDEKDEIEEEEVDEEEDEDIEEVDDADEGEEEYEYDYNEDERYDDLHSLLMRSNERQFSERNRREEVKLEEKEEKESPQEEELEVDVEDSREEKKEEDGPARSDDYDSIRHSLLEHLRRNSSSLSSSPIFPSSFESSRILNAARTGNRSRFRIIEEGTEELVEAEAEAEAETEANEEMNLEEIEEIVRDADDSVAEFVGLHWSDEENESKEEREEREEEEKEGEEELVGEEDDDGSNEIFYLSSDGPPFSEEEDAKEEEREEEGEQAEEELNEDTENVNDIPVDGGSPSSGDDQESGNERNSQPTEAEMVFY